MIKLNLDATASAVWSDVMTDILNQGKATSGSKAGSENGWIETTFGIEVMKIYC